MYNIDYYCPSCRKTEEHEVLKESHDRLVCCTSCHTVHHIPLEEEPEVIRVRTVVSAEETSRVCETEFLAGDECSVGDRLVAECGTEGVGVQITAIETGAKRVERAAAADISTLWARAIEEVLVRISLHDGRKTTPLEVRCPGEEVFTVGETYQLAGRRFHISHIKLRDSGVLRKEGYRTVASKIKRVYAYPGEPFRGRTRHT